MSALIYNTPLIVQRLACTEPQYPHTQSHTEHTDHTQATLHSCIEILNIKCVPVRQSASDMH